MVFRFPPRDITGYQGQVIFRGNDGRSGAEAWISDGDPDNTRLLRDIHLDHRRGSGAGEFTEFNGKLYFRAASQPWGHELWVTDGSNAGTQLLTDIWPGTEGGFPSDITVCRGELYFFANDGESGRELYRSDGTIGGTERVVDAVEGIRGVSGENLMVIGDQLFFLSVDGPPEAAGIWVSDGTAAGTRRVPIPGVDASDMDELYRTQLLTPFGDQLAFASGGKLYITDGTAEGSRESVAGAAHNLNGLAATGGRLYVSGAFGLSVYDQTLTTSTRVSPSSDGVVVSSGKAYFWNSTGLFVVEPDRTFTELVRFNPAFGTRMGTTHTVPGGMLFNINRALNIYEFWVTDGSAAGTEKIPETVTDDSAEPLEGFQQIGDSIYFVATNGKPRQSVWKVPAPVIDIVVPGVEGDVNGDELVDARDIDAVFAAVARASTDLVYDLNSDGQVTATDGEYLVTEVLETRPGDLTLDGSVNFADFLQLSANFGKQGQGWSGGDTDGDGMVGFTDFLALSTHFGFNRLEAALHDGGE